MKSSKTLTSGSPSAVAGLVASLLLVAVTLVASCDRRVSGRASVAGEADTLANGLPRPLAPKLEAWVRCWERAIPGFTAESLDRVGRRPFQFQSGQAGGGLKFVESVRSRALIVVLSPDSARAVDFDRYLEVDDGEGGASIEREPDSAPMLLDFAGDTLWSVGFCGTPCFYDGGYWVDASRFALTGGTKSGEQFDGPWQAFLEVRDLRTRQSMRWMSRTVDDEHFALYQAANDSALFARISRARSQAVSAAGAN